MVMRAYIEMTCILILVRNWEMYHTLCLVNPVVIEFYEGIAFCCNLSRVPPCLKQFISHNTIVDSLLKIDVVFVAVSSII